MSKLLDKLNKYKESCLDDCGYVIHGEAEDLVFQSAIIIDRYEKALSEIKRQIDTDFYPEERSLLLDVIYKISEESLKD